MKGEACTSGQEGCDAREDGAGDEDGKVEGGEVVVKDAGAWLSQEEERYEIDGPSCKVDTCIAQMVILEGYK